MISELLISKPCDFHLDDLPDLRGSIVSVGSESEDSSKETDGESSLGEGDTCDETDDIVVASLDDASVGAVVCSLENSSNEEETRLPFFGPISSSTRLRASYLLVIFAVMLADGLQGTHLYVLYEGYGYSVASLYCLGFVTGGIMSPVTGPLVDKIGRKRAAILYCALEMFINWLEQFPFLPGLIASRMIGGFTTNLLSQVFETWLDTEYRRRGLASDKYEIIMRDSVIVSNVAAIYSGYLAHVLAESYGPEGPFAGAVTCTAIALIAVAVAWTENYGYSADTMDQKDTVGMLREAFQAFKRNRNMRLVGIVQGLTAGSIQIFVFLWSPALRHFADAAKAGSWGLDSQGEPAYGLIFGAYMAAGVLGGLVAPFIRRSVSAVLSPPPGDKDDLTIVDVDGEKVEVRPMAVEFLAAFCYLFAGLLLMVPWMVSSSGEMSFAYSLTAFLAYEFLIGVFLPCEGVIRSLHFPATARASVMTLPRLVVNAAVSVGVVSTNVVSIKAAFSGVALLMVLSAALQLSLISDREWSTLWLRLTSCFETACATSTSAGVTISKIGARLNQCVSTPSIRRMLDSATKLVDSARTVCKIKKS